MTTPVPSAVTGALTVRAARVIRRLSAGTAALIAVGAMAQSYAGLHALALSAGVPPALAMVFPLMIDGLAVTGMLGVLFSTLAGVSAWYPWALVLAGVAASVWGNLAAAPGGVVSQAVHAASPIILALVLEELLRVTRFRVRQAACSPTAVGRAVSHAAPASPAGYGSQDGGVVGVQAAVEVDVGEGEAGQSQPPGASVDPEPPRPGADPHGAPATQQSAPREATSPRVTTSAVLPITAVAGGTTRERVTALLVGDPALTPQQVIQALGTDPSNTRKIIREVRSAMTGSGERGQ